MLHIIFIQFHILQIGHWSNDQEETNPTITGVVERSLLYFLFFMFDSDWVHWSVLWQLQNPAAAANIITTLSTSGGNFYFITSLHMGTNSISFCICLVSLLSKKTEFSMFLLVYEWFLFSFQSKNGNYPWLEANLWSYRQNIEHFFIFCRNWSSMSGDPKLNKIGGPIYFLLIISMQQ
jgi:hypothetical protein